MLIFSNIAFFCQRSRLENRPTQQWTRAHEEVGLWKTRLKYSRPFLPATDLKKLERVIANFRWEPFNQLRLSLTHVKTSSSLFKSPFNDRKGLEDQPIFQRTSFTSFAAVHVHVHVVVVVIIVVIVIVVVVVADIDVADVGETSAKEGKKEGLEHHYFT